MNFSDLVAPAFTAADDNSLRLPLLLLVVLGTCRRMSCVSMRLVVLAICANGLVDREAEEMLAFCCREEIVPGGFLSLCGGRRRGTVVRRRDAGTV